MSVDSSDAEPREELSYDSDPALVERLVEQSKEHQKEAAAVKARLAFLATKRKRTFQADSRPREPGATRCLGCGRWLVTASDGFWGPEWSCPSSRCKGWDYRYDKPEA